MSAFRTTFGAAVWLVCPVVLVDTSAAAQNHDPAAVRSSEPKATAENKRTASAEKFKQLLNSAKSALKQGHNKQAEGLFREAISEAEVLRIGDERLSGALFGLAYALHFQGKKAESSQHAKRALLIDEKLLGADHPRLVASLTRLAWLELDQGECADAERLYRRTLTIREKALGPDHPDVAQSLNNLAAVLLRASRLTSPPWHKSRWPADNIATLRTPSSDHSCSLRRTLAPRTRRSPLCSCLTPASSAKQAERPRPVNWKLARERSWRRCPDTTSLHRGEGREQTHDRPRLAF